MTIPVLRVALEFSPDYRVPVGRLALDGNVVMQMYRRMVFNVLAANRDDHTKQHALLLERDGAWRLSPAYDLTFASGPGNEHDLTVNGRGGDITRRDLLAVADAQSVSPRNASAIIDEVAAAVEQLPSIAGEFGVTRATLGEVKGVTARQLSLAAASGTDKGRAGGRQAR